MKCRFSSFSLIHAFLVSVTAELPKACPLLACHEINILISSTCHCVTKNIMYIVNKTKRIKKTSNSDLNNRPAAYLHHRKCLWTKI